VCTSAVVMLDTPCSEVVWRVLATHSICRFPLHFPSHVSCAITFQLDSTTKYGRLRLKCDGTCAETRFRLLAKRTNPFKSAGGCQFSRLLAAEVCTSAVVMLDTPCSEVVWRVLATHSICRFPLHFPSRVSPCAITFQLDSITKYGRLRLKCDGTRAETRFRLSAKQTNPFKSAGGCQFSRLLAAEVCASAVVMLDTPCSEVVWRVLATHCLHVTSPPVRHRVTSNWTLPCVMWIQKVVKVTVVQALL